MGAGGDPGSYRAGLDSGALLAGPGSLGLHEKSIPVRSAGLGSKRLVALGVQRMSVANGAIVLIDEVETGLEPHRLRHLVSTLRDAAADGGTMGQVFLTTHSPTSVVDTDAETLAVVRSEQGKTTVSRVPAGLQAVVRAAPDALLARRVVVAEGKTELGLCRAMATGWSESNQGVPAAHVGCVFVLGNGNAQAPTRSIEIASLGYDVALLADSDQPLNPAPQELAQGGVELFQWDEETCLEERLALDLPIDALSEVLEFAIELRGSQSVLDSLSDSVGNGVGRQESVEEYLRAGVSEEDIRTFIGQCANGQKWFKREDHGERLGGIVVAHLDAMNGTDTLQKLNALRDWVYA
ncbi:MAG: AAA family ATPase [Actinomycetota bacterium]